MKKLALLAAALWATAAWSQVYVAPHVRSDGVLVPGHWRSAPDHSIQNNYGTQGNINPYTGERGTVNPYQQLQPPHIAPPQRIHPPQPLLNGRPF